MTMDCNMLLPGACLTHGASPCPRSMYSFYKRNLASSSHHLSSSHIDCHVLPFPSPTHGHSYRWAAFCGTHPSQGELASSSLPISLSHCACGPLSVTIYVSPLMAVRFHCRCAGALVAVGIAGGCLPVPLCQASASVSDTSPPPSL